MTFRMVRPEARAARTEAEPLSDYRTRLALERARVEEQRQVDIAAQKSLLSSPEERIRAWEKVHGVRLPADPAHPVLFSVARATSLSLEDVRTEQLKRATPS
jgi:hypothetical protein